MSVLAASTGESLGVLAWWVLVPAVVVVMMVRGVRAERRRRERLMAWASSQGLEYAQDAPELVDRWQGSPFGRGNRRRAQNVVRGRHGDREVAAFEYRYSERRGSGKNRRTVTFHFTITAMVLPARLPRLELSPQDAGDRLAGWFGAQDIELESHEFNRQWVVKADEPKFASDILHPRAQELLLAGAAGRSLRFEGADLLCVTRGRLDPTDVAGRWALMADLIAQVPRFVWQDNGHDPDGTAAPQ